MQQLTAPPVMSSPTASMASGVPYSPPPQPRLGTPIPGTTGGLPALSGLTVYQNPMAQQLQSMGRGDDKMLVHMTPGEVQSLRGLAQLTGGDLTRNPHTGLPEAGWLGNLLPTILGGVGALFGIPTWLIGLGGIAGGTAATGSLSKGLMTGLQAFGGAGLTGALGGQGALGNILSGPKPPVPLPVGGATPPIAPTVGTSLTPVAGSNIVGAAPMSALGGTATGASVAPVAGSSVVGGAANLGGALPTATTAGSVTGITPSLGGLGQAAATQFVDPATQAAINATLQTGAQSAPGATGLLGRFKEATTIKPLGSLGATVGPAAAGLGLLTGVSGAFEKTAAKPEEEKTNFPYRGPYTSTRRQRTLEPIDLRGPNPSAQRSYFEPMQYYDRFGNEFIPGTPTAKPEPYYPTAAKGGELRSGKKRKQKLKMDEGSFIFPARETAELGNGSSRAGQEVLARMGGRPIDGKGDGVSDSIPARIGNRQEARVARDEVYFSPQAVARIGGGDHNRGTKKLYALMDKAKKARMRAAVGGDTGLRRGIV